MTFLPPLRSLSVFTAQQILAGTRNVLAEKQKKFVVCMLAHVHILLVSSCLRSFGLSYKDHTISYGGDTSECSPPRSLT